MAIKKYMLQIEDKIFTKLSDCFMEKVSVLLTISGIILVSQFWPAFFLLRGSRARTPKLLSQIMHFLKLIKDIDVFYRGQVLW